MEKERGVALWELEDCEKRGFGWEGRKGEEEDVRREPGHGAKHNGGVEEAEGGAGKVAHEDVESDWEEGAEEPVPVDG